MAPRDVAPGEDWAESIVNALEGARAMILVFSERANSSPQVKREVERAVNLGTPVIPFRVENVEPTKAMSYFLGVVHWLDAFPPPLEGHVERLAEETVSLLTAIDRTSTPDREDVGPLQSYLDQVLTVVASNPADQPYGVEASRLLGSWTRAVLPRLDGAEKGIALRFLYAAGLVHEPPVVDLSGVDLSGADLRGAVLPGIHLYSADLKNADLRGADLSGGTLQWACIDGMRVDQARLNGVTIVGNEIEGSGLDPLMLMELGADVRRPD
jgi:hypothetical protein